MLLSFIVLTFLLLFAPQQPPSEACVTRKIGCDPCCLYKASRKAPSSVSSLKHNMPTHTHNDADHHTPSNTVFTSGKPQDKMKKKKKNQIPDQEKKAQNSNIIIMRLVVYFQTSFSSVDSP